MSLYYVGVDGGGTSCRARIRDEHGQWVGEAKSGSANILLGVELAMQSIIEAIEQAARQGGISSTQFCQMHVGLALAGAEQKQAWQDFMALPHPFASLTLNTDAYGACIGAHNKGNGAILIAGTGSCGILLQEGVQHVVGGHEFPISDQGSGAVMGLRLIQQVLLAYDGVRDHSALSHRILAHFNDDIDTIVQWSKTALPRDYGQFSPDIFVYAQHGDPLAKELLSQTAADIDMWLSALQQKGAQRICLMGGIAERIGPWLSPPLRHLIVEPQFDAIEGALMFANCAEHNLYPEFLN
ncbi:N-acetylglucosamine kinase [Vibrio sp. SM6]|uniref:N-acetylglucosamine kinase n=1 Tax=Vibrio agarilyticus TaxID=2726741 RepID=A0A7X8TQH8_9VIBR|nr:N-acetylglucosamine kinase [Vibrio agarilyticus]NLS12752.1 N-acetylglucosamine kinase [Vibrio agarilyticus]